MKIKLSKSRWNFIGRKAGWIKKANDLPVVNKTDSIEIDDNSIREYENWLTEVLSNLKNITVQEDGNWYSSKPIIIDSFEYKNTGLPDYLNDFALLVNGIMKFHVNRTDISLNANIRNLFSQIKKEIDRLKSEKFILYQEYKKKEEEYKKAEEIRRKELKYNIQKYWEQSNFDRFIKPIEKDEDGHVYGGISEQDALYIFIESLKKTYPNDFSSEILQIGEEFDEDASETYTFENELTIEDLIRKNYFNTNYFRGLKTEELYPVDEIKAAISDFITPKSFDNFLIEQGANLDTSHYITKAANDKERQAAFEKDKEAYEQQENAFFDEALKRFNQGRTKKGLDIVDDSSQEFQDYLTGIIIRKYGKDIDDELGWDKDLLSSYKNWIRDNPFASGKEIEGFFERFRKNGDYYYEDPEQEYEYFRRKEELFGKRRNQKERKQKERNQKERNQKERNQKERKDERWKAIDDMFLFAKKHEIDLSKLNKKDFKGSCTKIYRILVNKLHPDKYLDKNKKIWAEKEFKILQQLWDKFKQVNEKDVFERIKKAINNIQWGLRRF